MQKSNVFEENSTINIEDNELYLNFLIASTHDGLINVWRVTFEKQHYVLKVISKVYLDSQTKIDHLQNEKKTLIELKHPGIVQLIRTMKDDDNLYLLMEIAYGAPLHAILRAELRLAETIAKYVVAQLCIIFRYVHANGYIYRDLKASNVILNTDGRVKLIDFGFSKKIDKGRTYSFCGTIHAMAPEFFKSLKEGYGYEIDHYALGILLHELIKGAPPFGYGNDLENSDIEQKIKTGLSTCDLNFVKNDKLKSLLFGLLNKDKSQRLGSVNGFEEIIDHAYFKDIDFETLEKFMEHDEKVKEIKPLADGMEVLDEILFMVGLKEESSTTTNEVAKKDPFADMFKFISNITEYSNKDVVENVL